MKTRVWTLIPGLLLAGSIGAGAPLASAEAGSSSVQSAPFAGRRADYMHQWRAPALEQADLAAMEESSGMPRRDPSYVGRRADHVPVILDRTRERAEFAAFEEGKGTAASGTAHSEPAYHGRRTDHLDRLR